MSELIRAVQQDDMTEVRRLVKAGADVNARDDLDLTALMIASFNGREKNVKMLIKAGADVNAKNNKDYTALMLASCNGHKRIVEMLTQAGARK